MATDEEMKKLYDKLSKEGKETVVIFNANPESRRGMQVVNFYLRFSTFMSTLYTGFFFAGKFAKYGDFMSYCLLSAIYLNSFYFYNINRKVIRNFVIKIEYNFEEDVFVIYKRRIMGKIRVIKLPPENLSISSEEISPGVIYFDATTGE